MDSRAAAPTIDGATHLHSGKVRDLYALPDGRLLMVASDRISAFDFILDSTIPDKGEILTRMSLWWFEQLADLVPHHVLSTDVPAQVRGRAVICERLEMYPVECVARGYLTGTGLLDYRATGEVCGIALPGGLEDGSRLPEPIFTPASKAAIGEHDENVSYDAVVATVGSDDGRETAGADAGGLCARGDDRARTRDHPGRHQARARSAYRRDDRAGRRGAHPRLVALLGGRRLAAGPGPAVVRQADRPQLAALARVRLGPTLGGRAAGAARPRSSSTRGRATSRPTRR